ncbi:MULTISPECIES: hypothetical protein [Bacillus cereus group]|uniref:Uncharacterized protein n=1 Tax=Bacillus mycoides TaxID=1405 RepID=A0ABC9QWB6_BACMY|nr:MULTISPECIES: hypothetical protein [Bacillus cereus group]EJR31161.1 hypothetical protein III_05387 [Bacillus mycoides]MDI6678834.1 hypothetical protein [Bacillus wiedmannii]MDM5254957.1 hypothetical protein [Bacillus toyonensis]
MGQKGHPVVVVKNEVETKISEDYTMLEFSYTATLFFQNKAAVYP